jgi:hypothetical protein
MCVLGMAEEFREIGIGVNALWPRTGKMKKSSLRRIKLFRDRNGCNCLGSGR